MPPIEKPKSPYQEHCERWKEGCGSDQCDGARRIVLCRGKLPCDVLFIGEAPGESEDVLGKPFVGPAGKLLDEIIDRASFESGAWEEKDVGDAHVGQPTLHMAWTNIVGCIPRNEDGDKAMEPSKKQIEKCRPRLREIVKIAKPKLIVFVGKLSDKYGPVALKGIKARTTKIIHPAAIIRAGVEQQGLLVQRAMVTLTSAFEDLVQAQ